MVSFENVYVLGGNIQQAEQFISSTGRNDLRILTNPDGLRGISRPMVICVGAYLARNDWDECIDMFASREALVVREL